MGADPDNRGCQHGSGPADTERGMLMTHIMNAIGDAVLSYRARHGEHATVVQLGVGTYQQLYASLLLMDIPCPPADYIKGRYSATLTIVPSDDYLVHAAGRASLDFEHLTGNI
jgi:hypothetical protein